MRITTALVTLAATLVLAPVAHLSPAAAAVEETRLRPGSLPLGAAPTVPVVEDRTLVDGDRRLTLPGRNPFLLGRSGTAYVVATSSRSGEQRVLRVEPDGTHRVLLDRTAGALVLAHDGSVLVESRLRARRSVQVVLDAATGQVLHRKRSGRYVTALAADADRVVLSGDAPARTSLWRLSDGATTRLSDRRAYRVDLSVDRMASFTGDPYRGGCTVVTSVTRPGRVLWRSCREAVQVFGPGGRMASVDKLSDGIGPQHVWARRDGGALVGEYSVRGWFGAITWESEEALLLEAAGRRVTATVRCVADTCERTGPTRPTEEP